MKISRALLLVAIIMIACMHVNAQQLQMDVRDFDNNIQMFDPAKPGAGKGAIVRYADIEGTPFWNEQWNPAIVYFNNGSKAKINQAKLNLYTNEIHYLNNEGTELVVENEGITRLVFLNKNNLSQPLASFALLVNHNTNRAIGNTIEFYRVFNAGEYQLILLQKQLVKTSPYDPLQGKSIVSFYTKKEYAIYHKGQVKGLNDLDRNSVLSALPQINNVENWLKQNNSKLKSETQVIAFLNYYNSLQP